MKLIYIYRREESREEAKKRKQERKKGRKKERKKERKKTDSDDLESKGKETRVRRQHWRSASRIESMVRTNY